MKAEIKGEVWNVVEFESKGRRSSVLFPTIMGRIKRRLNVTTAKYSAFRIDHEPYPQNFEQKETTTCESGKFGLSKHMAYVCIFVNPKIEELRV